MNKRSREQTQKMHQSQMGWKDGKKKSVPQKEEIETQSLYAELIPKKCLHHVAFLIHLMIYHLSN